MMLASDDYTRCPRTGGRKKKTATYRFKCKAYFYAIVVEVSKILGHEPSIAELKQFFGGATDSKNWYSYRAGNSMPERGTYKPNESSLRESIDSTLPIAPYWRDHALFTAMDRRDMSLKDVHKTIYSLPAPVSRPMIGSWNGEIRRHRRDVVSEVETLIEIGSIDALVALMCLVRESEWRDHLDLHCFASRGVMQLLPLLDSHDVLGPFAQELRDYIVAEFSVMWHPDPGVYPDGFR